MGSASQNRDYKARCSLCPCDERPNETQRKRLSRALNRGRLLAIHVHACVKLGTGMKLVSLAIDIFVAALRKTISFERVTISS